VPGGELVLTKEEAVSRFRLPSDRIGDLIVLGDQLTTFGRTPEWHDLSGVRPDFARTAACTNVECHS
jgi:phosphonoacetate hydrolase